MTAIKTAEIENIAGQLLYDGNTWILLNNDEEIITTSAAWAVERLQALVDYAPDPITWAEGVEAHIAVAIMEGRGEQVTTLPKEVATYARAWEWSVEWQRFAGEPTPLSTVPTQGRSR